ncbi:PLC-like phosphodiesterase [Annulohypoxylon truncatum]|uniref:PLC-like phosphodiesterase n=1 Tax=Annulohypoxylon truncatum TaxID=327061 RepID=UPI0020089D6A|nr:PLC-like phosphodiesterase [Annulohypoxylon truncatum]KAI1212918.1 PLC-like phosphodiesterase [Annulohypoxylon truncatum]
MFKMRGSSILCCLAASASVSATLATAAGNANSLAQFALQKVLQDGRDVFGEYTAASTSSSSSNASEPRFANWMAALPDSTLLSHVNIPGTHDQATWNYTQATQDFLRNATRCDGTTAYPAPVYRCQRESIAQALDKGIRFFDLRFAADPLGQRLVFWHSAALVSATASVGDVLYGVWDWLSRHGSETVLLSFQHEVGTVANATFDARVQGLMREALTGPAAEAFVWQGRGYVPTLAETRGKVVLVRRFDMDDDNDAGDGKGELPGLHMSPNKWNVNDTNGFALVFNETTNATAYIEDYYEPDVLGENSTVVSNIDAKMVAVKANLEKAASGEDPDSLFITFASAEHDSNIPPVVPETMALGNGTEVTPDGGVNHQLVSVLKGYRGKRLGVVVLDFFDEPEDLVALVLGDQV